MRPIAVVLVWVVLLGGLALYMQSRHYFSPPPENVYVIQPAPGEYTLEVTSTFDAQGGVDDYAEELVIQPAFVLSLRGSEIVRHAEPITAALPTTFQWDIEKWPLEIGKNEFHIHMLMPQDNVDAVYGVRLRLLRDGAEVHSHTIWSEPGHPVDGVMFFEIDAPANAHHSDTHTT